MSDSLFFTSELLFRSQTTSESVKKQTSEFPTLHLSDQEKWRPLAAPRGSSGLFHLPALIIADRPEADDAEKTERKKHELT